MAQHTPGPWFVHDFANPAVSNAPGPHDVTVSCVTPDHIEVASMGRAMTATLEEAQANARLIAAAPELLRAGKHLAVKLAEAYQIANLNPAECQAIQDFIAVVAKVEA